MRRLFGTSSRNFQRLSQASAPAPGSLRNSRPGMGKWQKRGLVLGGVGLGFYGWDRYYNASAILRASRCLRDLTWVGIDYKINFAEGHDVDALHERSAERIYNLMIKNKGLYIKMGQAVAIQAGMFPPAFQEKLGQLFDAAPQDSWKEVERLLTTEYQEAPDTFFDYIDHRAVASASIAQVHKAKLKTGEWVAVKVQHTDLDKQVDWDLFAYKWIMWIWDRYLFKMPIYFVAEHIADRLLQEVDFENELANAEETRRNVMADRSLRDHVYVPQNYPDLSTNRVMVSEWIEGVPLSNKVQLERHQFNTSEVMKWMIKLYSKQIYDWGLVHCDPHPGNIMLRYVNGRQQQVLIDHGLYIRESNKFRREYCSFWEAMFTADMDTMRYVSNEWGFGDSEMLASATMMQKYNVSENDAETSMEPTPQEEFEHHDKMREKFRQFLSDTEKIPLELIFLGRTMRIIQGLNRRFGSPINRIKVFAREASASNRYNAINKSWFRAWRDYLVFWGILILSDVTFALVRIQQVFLGNRGRGTEDFIDDQMRNAAKEMGFDYEDDETLLN